MPCCRQVSKYLCTFPCSCGGMVHCGKYTGLSIVIGIVCVIQSHYLRSSSYKEKTSGWSKLRSMNQFYWTCGIFVSFPKFNLKGRYCISASKSKSVALVLGLGANVGLSTELGGDISVDIASTCFYWTLMVLGTTGRNDISTSSPFLSMLALCSTWWSSTMYNLVANNGCCKQIFCLVVLIRIIGTDLALIIATHLFTTMPIGGLWCSVCSTRHVTFNGILFVCPRMVMTEFPEDANRIFSLIQLWPVLYTQFCYQNFVGLFWQVICFWGFSIFRLLGYSFGRYSQCTAFACVWMMADTELG